MGIAPKDYASEITQIWSKSHDPQRMPSKLVLTGDSSELSSITLALTIPALPPAPQKVGVIGEITRLPLAPQKVRPARKDPRHSSAPQKAGPVKGTRTKNRTLPGRKPQQNQNPRMQVLSIYRDLLLLVCRLQRDPLKVIEVIRHQRLLVGLGSCPRFLLRGRRSCSKVLALATSTW